MYKMYIKNVLFKFTAAGYRASKGGRGQALGSEQDQNPEYLKKMRTQQWLSGTVKRLNI